MSGLSPVLRFPAELSGTVESFDFDEKHDGQHLIIFSYYLRKLKVRSQYR